MDKNKAAKSKTAKTGSIYYRFLKLLGAAFLVSALFFVLLNRAGIILLNSYFEKTNYMERENQRRVEEFRDYVKKNGLASEDTEALTEWVRHQEVVWMQIYRDHTLLYDSQFPYMKVNPEYHVKGQFCEWDSYRNIEFRDGPALVFMTGIYTYQFFSYALIVEFFLAFLLFTGIIMAGIRSTMRYIRTLSAEIGILEGGNLDYRITVLGNDEMAVLARGLDNMRRSISAQIKQESDLIHLNQSMITSLSHDLRTPLTALLIYTEILKNEVDADREQRQRWIGKIDEKACQIKERADRILEYSLRKKPAQSAAMSRMPFRTAFYDVLSETYICLDQKGFTVQAKISCPDRDVYVEPNYITRILDNISSNIIKYASQEALVRITSFCDTACGGFLFENAKRDVDKTESTGIGLRNIREMMEEMEGSCEVEETEGAYRIRLVFPYADDSAGEPG